MHRKILTEKILIGNPPKVIEQQAGVYYYYGSAVKHVQVYIKKNLANKNRGEPKKI